jgi:hypothetical protein
MLRRKHLWRAPDGFPLHPRGWGAIGNRAAASRSMVAYHRATSAPPFWRLVFGVKSPDLLTQRHTLLLKVVPLRLPDPPRRSPGVRPVSAGSLCRRGSTPGSS